MSKTTVMVIGFGVFIPQIVFLSLTDQLAFAISGHHLISLPVMLMLSVLLFIDSFSLAIGITALVTERHHN